jgi:hypothetical protein
MRVELVERRERLVDRVLNAGGQGLRGDDPPLPDRLHPGPRRRAAIADDLLEDVDQLTIG